MEHIDAIIDDRDQGAIAGLFVLSGRIGIFRGGS
jgi:hypothetical protein